MPTSESEGLLPCGRSKIEDCGLGCQSTGKCLLPFLIEHGLFKRSPISQELDRQARLDQFTGLPLVLGTLDRFEVVPFQELTGIEYISEGTREI